MSGGATLDFGASAGANTFLFGTYTAPASGVLVVNNWQSGTDTLASTIGPQTVSSIYFSGIGAAQEAVTRLPIAVGFGISTPEQAAEVGALADGVVIGSAVVARMGRQGAAGALAWLRTVRRALDARG